jgi:P2-related tail formation protein
MKTLANISLYDLLPDNAKADPNISSACRSLDEQLGSLHDRVEKLSFFRRLHYGQITDAEADAKAWDYKLAYYDSTLPLVQKIELLKSAVETNRSKGTPAAIEGLITILFGEGYVQEWFEYDGEPGHYQVVTNNPDVTESRAQEFVRAIESVTRLSSRLDRVVLSQTESVTDLFIGFGTHVGERIKIN